MAHLYGQMLGPHHLTAAAALRQAQIAMARSANWNHPFYWAAFVAEGEWR
jgi:CHAT domain-containing protein